VTVQASGLMRRALIACIEQGQYLILVGYSQVKANN